MKKDEWLEKLKDWGGRKDRLLIIFLFGVLLLVIALPVERGKKADNLEEESGRDTENFGFGENVSEQEYVTRMERQLEEVLSQMKGVGDVTVMITLKESAERIVEKDTESTDESVSEEDSQGGVRETKNSTRGEATVYSGEDSGSFGGGGGQKGQEPYVRKEVTPRAEGVVVVAEGGGDAVVVQNITESVQALFGIDTHKIRIVKKD